MRRCVPAAAVFLVTPVFAGEIAGLPANTPPIVERPLEFSLSNDFMGGGAESDDYRTGQFIITGVIRGRWELTVDHSMLTLKEIDEPVRTDQLSATLGYRVVDQVGASSVTRVTAGLGYRGYGDFGGERIQNGAHQLMRAGVEIVPYSDLSRSDATAWADAHHLSWFGDVAGPDDWRWGYWLRGSALWASDGQLDAAIGAYGVASRNSVDIWLGARNDWRSGYEDPLLVEVTGQEEDFSIVFGLRWGPVIFETVQQLDNDASYGQIRLIAAGFGEERAGSQPSSFELGAEFVVPDVHLFLTGRWRADWLNEDDPRWARALLLTTGYGEPQHDDDPKVYRRAIHAAVSLEWEKRLGSEDSWASVYGSVGLGWRRVRMFGDKDREGERSDTVSRGIAVGALGVRFDGGEITRGYNYRVQLGLNGWAPFNDAELDLTGEVYRVQEPTLTFGLGFTVGSFAD